MFYNLKSIKVNLNASYGNISLESRIKLLREYLNKCEDFKLVIQSFDETSLKLLEIMYKEYSQKFNDYVSI